MAVAQNTVNDAFLTVYENGYAVYEMDGAHTGMAVERCGDYRYDFTDGTYQIIPAEEFENMEQDRNDGVQIAVEMLREVDRMWVVETMSPEFAVEQQIKETSESALAGRVIYHIRFLWYIKSREKAQKTYGW